MRLRSRPLPIVLIALAACSGGNEPSADATATSEITAGDPAPTPTEAVETAPAPIPPTAPPTTPSTVPSTTAPVTSPQTAPWAPIGAGPFEVGVATITIDDPAGVRPLTVDVWFPLDTTVDVGELAAQQYTLLPGIFYESPGAFAATAEQAESDQFPLIVYSHGSGALRYIHSAYTEALASHGYVAVAPDHTGNTAVDLIAGATPAPDEIAFNRPTDVRRVVDAFVDTGHPSAGAFAAHVDADRVAITGHSLGGFTTIAAVTGFENSLGVVAPDDRVDAIIPIAPASRSFSDEALAAIDVPMMVIVGTDDVTTPVDPNVTRLWDLTTNAPAYGVELVAAEHQTFTDICAYQEALPGIDNVPQVVIDTIDAYAVEGCSPGDMNYRRANDITTTYVVEFLAQVFRGGPPIDPTVIAPPDDVIFTAR